MPHPLWASIRPGDRHLLEPEACVCFDFAEARCRLLLAVGLEVRDRAPRGGPRRRHGLVLREETVALVRTCLLSRAPWFPARGSRLYRLPCHWGDTRADGTSGEGPEERG